LNYLITGNTEGNLSKIKEKPPSGLSIQTEVIPLAVPHKYLVRGFVNFNKISPKIIKEPPNSVNFPSKIAALHILLK
jgi:hypothetical protein